MTFRVRDLMRALLVLVVVAGPAAAGTWRCGITQTDCPGGCHFFGVLSPQDAMFRSEVLPGDTVMVWPGQYTPKVNLKSGIVLISFGGPSVTSFVGQAGAEPTVFFAGTAPTTALVGFTITWDSSMFGLGGGVSAYASSGKITDNIFVSNSAGVGSGIYLQTCDLLVRNNLFVTNNCLSGGGTVAISGGVPIIRNNTFSGNFAPFGYEGASVYATGSDFTFDRNIVHGSQGASAIFCGGGNHPSISCNVFWSNPLGAFAGQCVDSVGTSGNVAADPLFCNVAGQNFGVCSDSPALTGPCGTIGYTSPGGNCPACRPTSAGAAFAEMNWGRIKADYRR